jgi:hypothetical protein
MRTLVLLQWYLQGACRIVAGGDVPQNADDCERMHKLDIDLYCKIFHALRKSSQNQGSQ